MRSYVLVHDEWGVFLGKSLGCLVWSGVDPCGQRHAVAFESLSEVHAFLAEQPGPLAGARAIAVITDEEHDGRRFASIEVCVAAGLPAWNPEALPAVGLAS